MESKWGWKQPIPTTLDRIFKGDYWCKFVFIELLLRARISTEVVTKSGERQDEIELERGQCVCGEEEIGRMFKKSRQWGHDRLKKLQKHYNLINILATPKGTVITINFFDDIVDISSLLSNEKASYMHPKSTNKNDKQEKSVKQENKESEPFQKSQEEEKQTSSSSRQKLSDANEVWDYYIAKTNSREKKLPARIDKIKTRLKTFAVADCKVAIDNCIASAFHQGENKDNWKADVDWIFKSDTIVDKLVNLNPPHNRDDDQINESKPSHDDMFAAANNLSNIYPPRKKEQI